MQYELLTGRESGLQQIHVLSRPQQPVPEIRMRQAYDAKSAVSGGLSLEVNGAVFSYQVMCIHAGYGNGRA